MSLLPPFKYTGNKLKSADRIIAHYPVEIDTLIEPFCGSASVSLRMMELGRHVGQYVLSDINPVVCELLSEIRDTPEWITASYEANWALFNLVDTIDHKKRVYNGIRNRFNVNRHPYDFYFLTRTATNGLIRFNRKGEFNTSCHFTRPGMSPDKVTDKILHSSKLLRDNNVTIQCVGYDHYQRTDGYFFLDPPYQKGQEVYVSGFDSQAFYEWASRLIRFLLTIDDSCDYDFGDACDMITYASGESRFTKVLQDKHRMIYEKIYHKGLTSP